MLVIITQAIKNCVCACARAFSKELIGSLSVVDMPHYIFHSFGFFLLILVLQAVTCGVVSSCLFIIVKLSGQISLGFPGLNNVHYINKYCY